MDEIGILDKQDPTFSSVVSEKSKLLSSLPQADEELYQKWKRLEGHEEFLDLQEVSFAPLISLLSIEGLVGKRNRCTL